MILDASQMATALEAFAPLVGLPLSDMWRYAGCQKLEFGEQRPHTNRRGEEVWWADWGLVVSCDWRIEGPGGFVLSSDHFGEIRTDGHASAFCDSLEDDPPTVESVAVEADDGLRLALSKGYALLVLPDAEVDPEYDRWRLMPSRRRPARAPRDGGREPGVERGWGSGRGRRPVGVAKLSLALATLIRDRLHHLRTAAAQAPSHPNRGVNTKCIGRPGRKPASCVTHSPPITF